MANERIPNDPYRSPSEPYRPPFAGDDLRDPARVDNELQPDPELAEGPASRGRIAMFAAGIAVVLAAVFYGLNNSSVQQAGTAPVATTAQNNTQPPPAPPGMRDVTPGANTQPGVTTGAAPARPQTPPSSAPTGQDANRASNPPSDNTPPNK
jgi:hypothetical protein